MIDSSARREISSEASVAISKRARIMAWGTGDNRAKLSHPGSHDRSVLVGTAQPDGYTLLAGSMGSHVAAPVLTPNVKYDSERDFEPIGLTAHAPAVVVARKDFPAKDLREFVDYVKKNGDGVKQAHGGIDATSHTAYLLSAQKQEV